MLSLGLAPLSTSALLAPIDLLQTDFIPPVPISDSALRNKEVGLTVFGITIPGVSYDTIAIFIVKGVLEKIIDSTIDWINSGFDENPAFISDPSRYFTDIADGIAGDFINSTDAGFLCSPLQDNLKLSLALNYAKKTGRDDRGNSGSQCTLTGIANNIEDFYTDFSKGGWDSWFELTQTSKYNPYSAFVEADLELDLRIAGAVGAQSQKLDWGKGFLSRPGECLVFGDIGNGLDGCIEQAPDKTPGVVIEAQLEKVLGSGVTQLELADEFDELVSALLGQLVQKTVFGGIGLVTSGNTPKYKTSGGQETVGGGTQPPSSLVSCSASPESVIKGAPVKWTVTNSLGTTTATYLWSGEEISGKTDKSFDVIYSTEGIKNASVTATIPGREPIQVGCRNTVKVSLYAPLQVKCEPGRNSLTARRGEKVEWVATISGGTAGKTGEFAQLIWSGDENRITPPLGPEESQNAWSASPTKISVGNTTTITQSRIYDKLGNKSANLTAVDKENSVQAVYQQRCDGSIYIYE